MKYLNKSFSVYMANQKDPHCDKCGKKAEYYIQNQAGMFCPKCYSQDRQKTNYYEPREEPEMRGLGDTGHPHAGMF